MRVCSCVGGAKQVLLDIKADPRLAAGTLSDNYYAWTRRGHLLFLDQPGPVGFSFGRPVASSEAAAQGLSIVVLLA